MWGMDARWIDLLVTIGGAAAALTGLLFVAVAFGLARFATPP